MADHAITLRGLSIDSITSIIEEDQRLFLSNEVEDAIENCRKYLLLKIKKGDQAYYGINTGFGSLCDHVIQAEKLNDLQHNLIRSHAAGMGDEVPEHLVRLMLLLKIQNLSYGYSGVRLKLVKRLVDMYNQNLTPVIFEQGSLGASGDLAPLAHLSLPLIGEGEVRYKGQKMTSSEALEKLGWHPLELRAKEGLALLNGTQFSLAYAVWALIEIDRLINAVNMNAAMSMEAFNVQLSPLHPEVHRIRRHQAQRDVAAAIRKWLEGSKLQDRPGKKVQDPYAFRCAPQVHGASLQTVEHARQVVNDEISAVTDNPNVLPEEDEILSAGNFHAQPIALVLDYLAIAISELASISERRTFQLLSGERDLPGYLIEKAGLHSGFMIAQYTAASIVSQNKQLCTPASVDSIVSSMGQEDHVSMAANAATKLIRVVENVWSVLGIEFLCASQAVSLKGYAVGPKLQEVLSEFRKEVPLLEEDRPLHPDMEKAKNYLRYKSEWV